MDPPIPTYEEAITSRPTSSHHHGREEISDDAERQGLLESGGGTYRPPTVESERGSEDSDLHLPEVVIGDGDHDWRQIEELDYLDPSDQDSARSNGLYHRARVRSNFTKHWTNISATFSSIRLPSFRSLYSPVPAAEPTTPNEPSIQQSRLQQWLPSTSSRGVHIPEQYRLSAPTFARLCGLFAIAATIYILFAMDMMPGNPRHMGAHFDPESVRSFVQDHVNSDNIGNYLYHITSFDHVAGTEGDYYLASWMQEKWLEVGGFDNVHMMNYYVYLNYPKADGTGRSVKITKPNDKRWTAKLEEELVNPSRQQTLAFHGHSRSGSPEGHLIYANSGSKEDFQWLKDQGVETEHAIALIRSAGAQSDLPLKIRAAEEAGCWGVLIYTDPSDDGVVKGKTWPQGRWRPGDSLERGGVGLLSRIIGDPLTPGWASRKKSKTLNREANPGLPNIPSLPLPWRDAKVLIEALDGQGVKVPKSWVGGTEKGEAWFSGAKGKKSSPVVELKNINDENEKQRIWNLHGVIEGMESSDRKVVVGNHRDSWCFGAVDPGSGSAVMMEVVNIFLNLRKLGWRPLRTIEFVSFDAGEYNVMGSTEYVEDHIELIRKNGIAFLNVDAGVYGSDFHAAGSPVWKKALMHVLNRVTDPQSNSTLRQLWDNGNSALEGLGADGDHVPFQYMAGTSAINFGFEGKKDSFPHHSCYETFEWMQKFGDPGFEYHHTLAQIWALLILEIADRPLIPFDLGVYEQSTRFYIKQLQQNAENLYSEKNGGKVMDPTKLKEAEGFNLKPLYDAADKLGENARTFHQFEDVWSSNVLGSGGLESTSFALKRLDYNDRLAHFESDLLDLPQPGENNGKGKLKHGVQGREQYKHVLSAPHLWNGHEVTYFPAVSDALDSGDWKLAQKMVERAAEVLERAGERLVN